MRNIKLTIEYDGGNYKGWQRQPEGNSIEEEIEKILSMMMNTEIDILGSGRTDSGVHAKGQVANFYTESNIKTDKIKYALNRMLPSDIYIIDAEEVDLKFNARKSAHEKTYRYVVYNCDQPSVFYERYSFYVSKKLNIEKMIEASKLLIGEKDFKVYSKLGSSTKTSIRNLKNIEIKREGNFIYFYYTANGFLYNMVRMITGTLIEVGMGKKSIEHIKLALETGDKKYVGKNAPSRGLTLMEVKYNNL